MLSYIREEPVLLQGLIQAALALLVAFGTHLTATQVGSIVAFTAALLSCLTRSQVTPVANPKAIDGATLASANGAATVGGAH